MYRTRGVTRRVQNIYCAADVWAEIEHRERPGMRYVERQQLRLVVRRETANEACGT